MFCIKQLDKLQTFAERLRYAKQLPIIGTGSSRRVFDLGNGHVIKLALNPKGLAQNNTESDYLISSHYSEFFNPIVDSHPNNYWIVAHKADRLTRGHTLSHFKIGLYHFLNRWSDFLPEILNVCYEFDLQRDELGERSAWGVVGNKIKVIDFGLSKFVYEQYYSYGAKQRQKIRYIY